MLSKNMGKGKKEQENLLKKRQMKTLSITNKQLYSVSHDFSTHK